MSITWSLLCNALDGHVTPVELQLGIDRDPRDHEGPLRITAASPRHHHAENRANHRLHIGRKKHCAA